MVVDEYLRAPAQDAVHHRPYLGLALRKQVAVHVEAEVAVPARDAPRLVLFERPRVVRADADGVVPGGKTLMTIGVRRWVEHDDHRFQDLQGLRLIGRRELISHLHGGLEAGRFVAVDRILEHRDGRALRSDRGRPRRRRLARIGQLGQTCPDLVELCEVRRVGDDQRPNRAVLGRAAPRLDPHAVARAGDQSVEIVLHDCIHGVLFAGGVAGDRLGTGHGRSVGSAGVKVEGFLGGERGHERHDGQQGKAGAHGCTVVCCGV